MADIDVEEHAKTTRLIFKCSGTTGIITVLMLALLAAKDGGFLAGMIAALFALITLFMGWIAGRATGELAHLRGWAKRP